MLLSHSIARWWRFDGYEIRAGSIQPVGGAHLEKFDPLAAYNQLGGQVGVPPYARLIELARSIPPNIPLGKESAEVTPELESGILEWCTEYGLLGLLPHTTLFVRLGFTVMSRSHEPWPEILELPLTDEAFEACLASGAIVQPVHGDPCSQPIDTAWAPYFPHVRPEERETHSYPPPLSDDFWQAYTEPVDSFLQASRHLANAVLRLSMEEDIKEGEHGVLEKDGALDRLNQIAAVVSPRVTRSPSGKLRREWVSPSLLGTLAMQAAQDLLGSRRAIICEACGKLFTTSNPNGRHCTERCGNRHRQQRWRDSQRRKQPKRTRRGRK